MGTRILQVLIHTILSFLLNLVIMYTHLVLMTVMDSRPQYVVPAAGTHNYYSNKCDKKLLLNGACTCTYIIIVFSISV